MISNELQICRAGYKEMYDIAEIIRSTASWYKPFLAPKDMKEHVVGKEWIDKNFELRDFYVAKNAKQQVQGCISFQHFDRHTYLGYIYVHEEHTGKGLGPKMMDFGRRLCATMGQESMFLISHPKARWAVKAYERFGFKKKCDNKESVLAFKNGLLKPYYEEGFHLFEYELSVFDYLDARNERYHEEKSRGTWV